MSTPYLSPAQFKAELEKCLQCKTKPCQTACPVKCSPHDFIAAAKNADIAMAASHITAYNPLGEVCGLVCPDKFCMRACLRQHIDAPIKIPQVQAEIMRRARQQKFMPVSGKPHLNATRIAIVGAGPAGIGAAAVLLPLGFETEVFEQHSTVGGALNLIPPIRLPREVIAAEWAKFAQYPNLHLHNNTKVTDFKSLLKQGFSAVIAATGEQKSRILGIEGENLATDYTAYLQTPEKYATNGKVAVVGGGAAAVDCAVTAAKAGATQVEMFVRRRLSDMRISDAERKLLLEQQIDISTMTRVTKIEKQQNNLTLYTCKTQFTTDGKLADIPQTQIPRPNFALTITALGSTRLHDIAETENIFYAGDFLNGSSTVVEALASGKKVAKIIVEKIKNTIR